MRPRDLVVSPLLVLLFFPWGCGAALPAAEPHAPASAPSGPSSPEASATTTSAAPPAAGAAEAPSEEELVGFRAQAVGPHYKVHAALVGTCTAGEECRIRVTLEALDGYRVSAPYPERLEVRDATNMEPLGTDPAGKATFSKAAGDFTVDANHPDKGSMMVRFRGGSRGMAQMTALFYIAVETDKETTIARPMLSFSVPVK
jgi:hypothetical protein